MRSRQRTTATLAAWTSRWGGPGVQIRKPGALQGRHLLQERLDLLGGWQAASCSRPLLLVMKQMQQGRAPRRRLVGRLSPAAAPPCPPTYLPNLPTCQTDPGAAGGDCAAHHAPRPVCEAGHQAAQGRAAARAAGWVQAAAGQGRQDGQRLAWGRHAKAQCWTACSVMQRMDRTTTANVGRRRAPPPRPASTAVAAPCPPTAPARAGTGKTLIARACAAQTNATFLKLAGTSLVQVGCG